VEMLRRFVLVGLMVLVQGSLQLLVGTLLSAAFLLFQVQASPYKEMSDDFLASSSSFCLVAAFLASSAFKQYEFFGQRDIHDSMSIEQHAMYVLNQSVLTVIMLASVLGVLVLSFVLYVVQCMNEHKRRHREALAAKARRLRYKADNTLVIVPVLPSSTTAKRFHLFLSHVWGTGQDQMRVVKQRLLEMIPDLSIFLDVDDLEIIGDLERYLDRTSTVLVYCSRGYFVSKNCMRELTHTTVKQKPTIALMDLDLSHGGLTLEGVQIGLDAADAFYAKWGFNKEPEAPRAKLLYEHLTTHEPIEWNRIGHFQDVTMRLIAERLLPNAAGTTYVDHELINQKRKLLSPPSATYHVYCSAFNPGAKELIEEVSGKCGLELKIEAKATPNTPNTLCMTTDVANLPQCDHMMLYLTGQTWTCHGGSAALGHELQEAMEIGVHVQLAHEMPGVGGQEARFACDFGTFFGHPDGTTPQELLERGIYSEIAIPLKGGAWREASMVLMGIALGMNKEEIAEEEDGANLLGLDESTQVQIKHAITSVRIHELHSRVSAMTGASSSMRDVFAGISTSDNSVTDL